MDARLQPRSLQIISDSKQRENAMPLLCELSKGTEFGHYKEEQWKFVLLAGDITLLVVSDGTATERFLGCLLRVGFGEEDAGYGMMLVSPAARGLGIAKTLLATAMKLKPSQGLHILGMCSELGAPMYKKMGYKSVASVTKVSAPLRFEPDTSAAPQLSFELVVWPEGATETLLRMDQRVTSLDRAHTIRAVVAASKLLVVARERESSHAIGIALARCDANALVVGPIEGDERCVLPLLASLRSPALTADLQLDAISVLIAGHDALVSRLVAEAGFTVDFVNPTMTFGGVPLPGERSGYIGLIHPTIG
uniref:N-acetyltransferase domain-containing protein n=1 Tax=Chrysotila carterae TaxID=13221 RepID=A0A7S4F0U2_CHRCT